MADSTNPNIVLVVQREHVKSVKSLLEMQSKLDKSKMICPYHGSDIHTEEVQCMVIPTTIQDYDESSSLETLSLLGLEHLEKFITILRPVGPIGRDNLTFKGNPLIRIINSWLEELPEELLQSMNIMIESVVSEMPTTYSIYPPMLLLPSGSFTSPVWKLLLSRIHYTQLQRLYRLLSTAFSVTHIAVNGPIPHSSSNDPSKTNILRSPTNFRPLFGDFGPQFTPTVPDSSDFARALWVSTLQNGIHQVWSPRYTMFSRGNIREKTRLLSIPSVQKAVEQGELDGRGCAAVDMYAGIGYFAFSYAKAGIRKVYCWEMNPWSVEGLRRGVEANGWTVEVIRNQDSKDGQSFDCSYGRPQDKRFQVFEMDNEHAMETIKNLQANEPPIRHVNCGLLPSSKASWMTAVKIIDIELGGWIHLHENYTLDEIEMKAQKALEDIQQIIDESHGDNRGTAALNHIERVKTYAPGVMHCVLDIYIPPHKH